jgi:phosphomannomutase
VNINSSIFRAYDIRGKYPSEINEDIALKIGNIISQKILPEGKVVIAMDARNSSQKIYIALEKAFKKREIINVGFATTPMFYFLVNKLNAVGGVMITASHNPQEWNGLKVVGPKTDPITGKEIEAAIR